MKNFFKNRSNIVLTSLIATIVMLVLLIFILSFADYKAPSFQMFGKIFMAIALPFLILNPILGFIYSFFIKGKNKILYISLNFICICTISAFAFITFMFRYFVPFAP